MASEGDIEKIRERIDIVQLISAHTTLRKRGTNYLGLCPFHREKTPSFTVNSERRMWHCFGCGKGGDIFSFVMETDNVQFGEAVETLARMAGVQLEAFRPEQAGRAQERETIMKLNRLAASYFEKALALERAGAPFREYLAKREMPPELVKEYRIGASLEAWDGLIKTVAKRGVKLEILERAGLAIIKDLKENRAYDRFRNRLMFPLFNAVGDIIGFAGRAMGDAMPKYMNTPETPVFDKGKMLYNLHIAKKHVGGENGGLILVEGYMDVLALVKAGIRNTVASMGTALTSNQVDMIKRYCNRVHLSYDSDIAGDAASMRGIELLVDRGIDIRVLSLPKGQDPDDVIRTGGRDAYLAQVESAQGYFPYFLEKSILKRKSSDANALRDIILELTPLILKSPNEILQDEQTRLMADRLGVDERRVRSVMSSASAPKTQQGKNDSEIATLALTGAEIVEKKVIQHLFSDKESAAKILTRLDASYFREKKYRALFSYCSKYFEEKGSFNPDGFLNDNHPQEIVTLASGVSLAGNKDGQGAVADIDALLDKFMTDVKKRRISDLRSQIMRAEKEGDRNLVARLMTEMNKIKRDII